MQQSCRWCPKSHQSDMHKRRTIKWASGQALPNTHIYIYVCTYGHLNCRQLLLRMWLSSWFNCGFNKMPVQKIRTCVRSSRWPHGDTWHNACRSLWKPVAMSGHSVPKNLKWLKNSCKQIFSNFFTQKRHPFACTKISLSRTLTLCCTMYLGIHNCGEIISSGFVLFCSVMHCAESRPKHLWK